MLDLGWSELLLIGVVALIVVGPKDLPRLFRSVGQYVGKARNMAREFQRAMDQAADESGVKDMAKDLKSSVSGKDLGLDGLKDLPRSPKKWARDAVRDNVMGGDDPLSDIDDIDKSSGGIKPRKAPAPSTADEAAADLADADGTPPPAPVPSDKPVTTPLRASEPTPPRAGEPTPGASHDAKPGGKA